MAEYPEAQQQRGGWSVAIDDDAKQLAVDAHIGTHDILHADAAAQQPAPSADEQTSSAFAACMASAYPAVKAAALGNFRCLQLLQQQGKVFGVADKSGATPLHAAVRYGHLNCALWLVDRTGADTRSRDKVGGTPGHHAAYHGQLACLKWLIRTDPAVATASAADGGTPVHFAAATGNLECLRWLCSSEGGGNPNDLDNNGTTPLYFAAQEGHLRCVHWLLQSGNASPTQQAHDGMCAIHAAAQAGRTACLRELVAGTDKPMRRICDNDGATPVHFAAAQGHIKTLQLLLEEAKCTGNEKDSIGATPVHDAAEQGQLDCLKLLARHGAELTVVDRDGYSPRQLAQEDGRTACADFLAVAIGRKAQGLPPVEGGEPVPVAASPIQVDFSPREPEGAVAAAQDQEAPPSPLFDEAATNDPDRPESSLSAREELELIDALDDLREHMDKMADVATQLGTVERDDPDGVIRPDLAGKAPAVSRDRTPRGSRASSPLNVSSSSSPESVIMRSRSQHGIRHEATSPPAIAEEPGEEAEAEAVEVEAEDTSASPMKTTAPLSAVPTLGADSPPERRLTPKQARKAEKLRKKEEKELNKEKRRVEKMAKRVSKDNVKKGWFFKKSSKDLLTDGSRNGAGMGAPPGGQRPQEGSTGEEEEDVPIPEEMRDVNVFKTKSQRRKKNNRKSVVDADLVVPAV